MKQSILIAMLFGAALGFRGHVEAQEVHQGESFTLSAPLSYGQSHAYVAGGHIELLPGFRSELVSPNYAMMEIDPYFNPDNTYGLLYNAPADQSIEGRLGFYPMDFRVNECGAATISMPLEFPEGINGMTPRLSLEYNSQAGNGIMGIGWSLGGMSKISRVPYTYEYDSVTHSVQFSAEDQLSLDGVILKKGTFNGSTCYYPEIYDYSVVLPIAGGFKVLKSNGLVYYYTSKYYLQQSINEPIEWHLTKIEDADGNRIEYEYVNNRGEGAFRPDRIRYTCREGLPPAYETRFVYDTNDMRPDCPRKWFSQPADFSCNTGFSRVKGKLAGIDCYHGTQKVVSYSFGYDTVDWNVRALAYVEKSFHSTPNGRWAVNRLIPTRFLWASAHHCLQYERAGAAVTLNIAYDDDHQWYQQTAFPARFEEDKMYQAQKYEHDIVHLMRHDSNNGARYFLSVFRSGNIIGEQNQAYSYNPPGYLYDCSTINQNFNDGRDIHAFVPADTDGDGLDEIVCVHTLAGRLKVSLIKPVAGVFQETVHVNEPLSSFDPSSFQAGDFNGDGLADLLCVCQNRLHAWMSSPSGPFSQNAASGTDITGHRRIVAADFSGDRKDQVLVLRQTNGNNEALFFRVARLQNGSFNIPAPGSLAVDMAAQYSGSSCNRLCCGDFNGDGKKDILLMCSGAWRFYFSQGNGMFTGAQLMNDPVIVNDDFALSKEGNPNTQSFAMVADFDHDGCDDVSITLLQDFYRPSQYQYHDDMYRGAFRRDFLVRPTHQDIRVRRIRNLRGWWENGVLHETDICIDSLVTNSGAFTTNNALLPVLGNHKGTSPTEILYCRLSGVPDHSTLIAHLHNTGCFLPDSLARGVSGIVNSLGATTEIRYWPVSFQRPQNENAYGLTDPGRSTAPVLPYNGYLSIVEQVVEEIKDNGAAQDPRKSCRLTRHFYSRPYYHIRGRGLLGFGSVWSRKQGQVPMHDVVTVRNHALDQSRHVLVPESLFCKHFRGNSPHLMDLHLRTDYTCTFQDNTDFASALGQIPSGVFAPYLSSSVTVRDDGSPVKYEETVTARDGYGNVIQSERRYGTSASSFPFYERTVTAYEHSVSPNRWILGVPLAETVTHSLTDVAADQVVRHTDWQNDMAHGRHRSMVREPGSGKQLTETYGYDVFGHLDTVTRDIGDGSPRTETLAYTADGRFMSSQTNAAGHTTHYHYDTATGLLDSVTDPNGLVTRYRYNELWDLEQTEYPSGVREDRCMMWVDTCHLHADTWHPDTPSFGAPVYFIWSKRSGERESVVFYDQHRRKLREVGGTLDGKKVYVDYRYHDVTGLLAEESAPYHPGDGETPQFTQYTYDYLDRKTMEDRPDGAYRSHSYNGLTEIVRGFDGQVKTLTYSRAGLVNKVSDGGNTTSSPVDIDYTWYGDGKVKNVKVGGNNATMTSYTYDVNRNPATVSDPSLGQLTYDYNGFGELVGSATPRDTAQYTYDALGRMTARTGYDGSSSWTYDSGFLGALSRTVYTPVTGPSVTEQFTYDRLGRPTRRTQAVGSQDEWAFGYGYDAMGRRNTVAYPSGKKFKWHYDRNGFMDWVSDVETGTPVWQATATDRWGNTTAFSEGDIGVDYAFDPVTGLVTGISARRNGQPLFGQACSWSAEGNLEWRTDSTLNLRETFAYDRFNRLVADTAWNLPKTVRHATQGVQFDDGGNITQKDGVGGFAYGGSNPYAVTALGQDNALAGLPADQTVAYTPFDKVGAVTQDGMTLSVGYGIDRQRVTQTFSDGSTTRAKRYFTPLYETVTENGVTKKLHYLTSATGLFAIFVSTSSGGGTMYYTLKDHQGSLAAVIHGSTVERLSYDPWGRRRNTTNFGYDNVSHTFDRGYTLHEHYDGFDLINMNGRLYDPILGRMLSPDVVIQDEQNSQAYNRYSYCFNNPLRFTDPSGYLVTIPPEFEKYYMPQYLDDFERYKTELEKMDAQNVAFNTELSEGKSVTTLTWTLGEDSYQMTIVDHGLKDYEQMCENSCVAAALAAQEARFTKGNKELTENFILSLFDKPCETGLYVDKVLLVYKKYSNIYKKYTYFDMTKQLAYYEKRSFDEMNLDRGVLIRLYNDQMRHVFNVSQAIEFVINNNIKSHEIRLWDSDFQNEKKGGYKSFTDYDMKKFFGKMGVLY